jgi:GH15 family glucan-1,4-alpha-glucosidase
VPAKTTRAPGCAGRGLAERIEHYGLIGDLHTAALVGSMGSIDWLCFPRFDSPACFAALLGTEEHGHWCITPREEIRAVTRRYRTGSLVLETDLETDSGCVRLIDFMPVSDHRWDVVRIVQGVRGKVDMRMELIVRFDYGSIVPWVRRTDGVLLFTGGPDTLELFSSEEVQGENFKTVAEFTVSRQRKASFSLNYRPSHLQNVKPINAARALRDTERHWRKWSRRCKYRGRWRAQVTRSLVTLKALTFKPTGGMVAAVTTSLPEEPGGVRNWDYRFCWLRDATFTLNALLLAGYEEEAFAWQDWLLRAIAGSPDDMQIMYGVSGVRRLDEVELPWLPGYEQSVPVRIGNAASRQFQLDVYGEVMDMLHLARAADLQPHESAWRVQLSMLSFLSTRWKDPDEGIWEVRGPPQHFTHSKVMAWVAFDRAIKDAAEYGLDGPLDEWRVTRDAIHTEVCKRAWNSELSSFVQAYGSTNLDASLLLIPQFGFLPADDERLLGTIAAIESRLMVDGLVMRYSTDTNIDALPPGEGAFLPCSFWFVDALALSGRKSDATAMFERLLTLGNDLGLFAEEYDPRVPRMLGNFPQALTHMALINSARLLSMPQRRARKAVARGERPTAKRL